MQTSKPKQIALLNSSILVIRWSAGATIKEASGFIFQISSMPVWLQYITHVIPASYYIVILQCIFLSGDIYEVILPNVIAMLIVGTVIFSVIVKITKKRLD